MGDRADRKDRSGSIHKPSEVNLAKEHGTGVERTISLSVIDLTLFTEEK